MARRLDVAEPAARVWHEPTDAALVAGSYTSVAQDETDVSGLELELATARTNGRDSVIATPRGEGLLAVIVLRGEDDPPGHRW